MALLVQESETGVNVKHNNWFNLNNQTNGSVENAQKLKGKKHTVLNVQI